MLAAADAAAAERAKAEADAAQAVASAAERVHAAGAIGGQVLDEVTARVASSRPSALATKKGSIEKKPELRLLQDGPWLARDLAATKPKPVASPAVVFDL